MAKILRNLLVASIFMLLVRINPVHAAGTFALSPSSGNLIRGCTQSTSIMTSITSGQSNAADIIIYYDTTNIEILDALPEIPGIQILPGNAYESYAGNSVNTTTGQIKLVGYSSGSSLSGTATFATIRYRSKPLAAQGGFAINFTGADPYNTLDSNIADAATSYDMLSNVSNATYSFITGTCTTDTTPPNITFVSPTNLQNNVDPGTAVIIKLSDAQSGISLPSLQIVINGTIYTSTSSEVSISGTPSNYTVTIHPSSPFPANSVSVISASIGDTAGNERNANISINSGYSCPVTYVTKPGLCPSPSQSTTPIDRISPVVTVTSDTIIDVGKSFKIVVKVHDSNGISPSSFIFTVGNKIFTIAGTPDQIAVSGSKTDYNFEILLNPEDMESAKDGTLLATAKISDLEGNTRIQQLQFRTIGGKSEQKPQSPVVSTVTEIFNEIITVAAKYVAPILTFTYLLSFVILNVQPTVAYVYDEKKKPIRFPHGYLIYSNGARQKLFGGFDGRLHGRIPRESTTLVVQKYGFTTTSIPIPVTVKYDFKKVALRKL